MENASKALIIAGAILLSILIIGLGMFIYNQAADVMGDTGMDEIQVQQYNAEFLRYEETQNGTSVRQLCEKVRSHNNANIDDPSLQIGIVYGSHGTAKEDESKIDVEIPASVATQVRSQIRAGKMYTVSFNYANSGRIINVVIADKTSGSGSGTTT